MVTEVMPAVLRPYILKPLSRTTFSLMFSRKRDLSYMYILYFNATLLCRYYEQPRDRLLNLLLLKPVT